jgi:hypothetical protein
MNNMLVTGLKMWKDEKIISMFIFKCIMETT